MINIEKISEKIFNLDAFSHIDKTQRLKAQYGFSIVLGIVIEFALAVSISYFIGTYNYLWLIMITALIFRMFMEGEHCSSYDRCAVFTIVYFIGGSLIIKYINSLNDVTTGIICISIAIVNMCIFARGNVIRGLKITLCLYILMILIYIFKKGFLIYMICIVFGQFLQIFSTTKIGRSYVIFCDELLSKSGF